jgi:hypothetical protein
MQLPGSGTGCAGHDWGITDIEWMYHLPEAGPARRS